MILIETWFETTKDKNDTITLAIAQVYAIGILFYKVNIYLL